MRTKGKPNENELNLFLVCIALCISLYRFYLVCTVFFQYVNGVFKFKKYNEPKRVMKRLTMLALIFVITLAHL